MSDVTRLDTAFAAMQADPDDDTARLGFFETLAAAELFVLLEAEPEGDRIAPRVLELQGETFVMVFDSEERMVRMVEEPVPYAALSGRVLAQMLAPEGIGIALNIDVAPSSTFLLGEEIVWLSETLDQTPEETEQRIETLFPPRDLPEQFLRALDARLAASAGLARSAYLVGAQYAGGAQGHLLGIVDVMPGAEAALTRMISEALTFSGLEAAILDIGFFASHDPFTARLAKHGLRFDLPEPKAANTPAAPGLDPDKPPRLH